MIKRQNGRRVCLNPTPLYSQLNHPDINYLNATCQYIVS